jgi:HlyD family secretion protein
VRLARAERAKAAAELEFADAELKRATELRKQGTISEATLDRARLAVKTARAALEQSTAALAKRQADLDSARAALSSTRAGGQPMIAVTSPVSGRVMKRMQESSQLIAAGTPLLEVGNPAELEIVTDLLSADAVRVREGAEVIIEEWGGQEPLRGTVRRVEPFGFTKISALGIEEQRVNVITDFVSPREKWASLGHGYRVMTRMVVSQRRGVLKVPVSALFRTGEDWTVFAVNDRRAVVRKVTVGLRNPLEAEILDGLTEKDQVILHPSDRIADGVTVEPRA